MTGFFEPVVSSENGPALPNSEAMGLSLRQGESCFA